MITISQHTTDFFEKIKNSTPAFILVNHLLEHFGPNSDVEVHFTGSQGGVDLRVRVFLNSDSGRTERNIFTMAWRPSKNIFICRILSGIVEGGPVSNVRTVNDPLPVEFSLSPAIPCNRGPAGVLLVEMIESKMNEFKVLR